MARDRWLRERIDPMRVRSDHGQLLEHLSRYRWAATRLRGRVLDAGCGTGYGSALLAGGSAVTEVLGLDRDARAIRQAQRYYRGGSVVFARQELLAPSLSNWGMFDGIVCLETLEHLEQPELLLQRLDHCLSPGGRLLLSTPLGAGRDLPSRQIGHRFQLRRSEFEALLRPRFRYWLFGQRGQMIESWRHGGRYFLVLGWCRSRFDLLH
jgi:2-polyprenyl-3-methyl-5-hydroxy-6-metoxy-1,4-benzoquinol methylase